MRHSNDIYFYEPDILAGIVNIKKNPESKHETSEESAKQDDAGVKIYNEKFKNLIYTCTDVVQ